MLSGRDLFGRGRALLVVPELPETCQSFQKPARCRRCTQGPRRAARLQQLMNSERCGYAKSGPGLNAEAVVSRLHREAIELPKAAAGSWERRV